MRDDLSDADVLELLSNPVAEIRAKLATKVANQITNDVLTPNEKEIANDILRKMSLDVSVVVRQSIAENLRHATELPSDVAMALARDVEAVALPMLESSPAFTDADLVELVKIGTSAKQIAIAKRETVSDTVAYALIEMENSDAVVAVLANAGAEIGERSLDLALDLYGDNDEVKEAMTHRDRLPVRIAERLVTLVSEQLRQYLMVHHELSAELVANVVFEGREQATMGFIGAGSDPDETAKLVSQLYSHGRLTPSLVLRALCLGDMDFCEHAFAHLAVVPIEHARKLIHDPGPLGFEAIFERAGMPPGLFPIFELAIDVFGELALDFQSDSRDRFCARMFEHVKNGGHNFNDADREYLLKTLSRITAAA
ncbi:MAG: DUF2336 domain-containing protein [Sphingomonadales bacterium]